jgi:ribosome-associated translation inhibitor RaiA
MEELNFTFEFHTDVPNLSDSLQASLRDSAQEQLLALTKGHDDSVGASVAIDQPIDGESPYLYRARVVVYARSEQIVAVQRSEAIKSALRSALSAVKRQVREKRERLS